MLALIILTSNLCVAQQEGTEVDPKPPAVELLKLSGSTPILSASGEGVTSFKTSDLFQRGVTAVRLDDAILKDPRLKIEFPTGYTIFNKLVYVIDTKAVFSGPNDVTFLISSATTRESFDRLRILYPEYDSAQPEKPRWVDATLRAEAVAYLQHYLSKADFDKRLPDYDNRTLHAFLHQDPGVFVVALKDPSVARDKFVADLSIEGTAPEQVVEGAAVTYDLTVVNHGPDTATGIALHATSSFEFVAVKASQDKCRMEANNVYCSFTSLEKDKTISIKIIEKCPWDRYFHIGPPGQDPPGRENETGSENKFVDVHASEGDPTFDNNTKQFFLRISKDTNKAPVVEITNPKKDELFQGPDPTVTIVARASDPDGFVNKVEFFDQGVPIGEGVLAGEGEYRLEYKKLAFGRHWVEARVTDNLGREAYYKWSDFFVNGPAKVEIIDPKPGELLEADGEVVISVRASHPGHTLKKVQLNPGWRSEAAQVGDDLYVKKFKVPAEQRIIEFTATVIDDSDLETRSVPVTLKIRNPPQVTLNFYDGEYLLPLTEGKASTYLPKLRFLATVGTAHVIEDLNIVKTDFYADGKLIYTDTQQGRNSTDNEWVECPLAGLAPGTYKVQAVATDSDGSVGKSAVVEIVIKAP